MRKQKTLKLNDDITVTVLELRPRDLKHAIGLIQGGGDFDFQKLITEDWDDALAKLSGVIRADQGSLEDLSFSEIEEVRDAFVEVNTSFLDLLNKMGLNIGWAGPNSSAGSIGPASPLSSEDMPDASITVGVSS
jgi:hypothetical protein